MRTGDRMCRQLAVGASGGRAGVRDCKMPCRNAGRPRSINILCGGPAFRPLAFLRIKCIRKVEQLFGLMRSSSNSPAAARRGNADCCLKFRGRCLRHIPHLRPTNGRAGDVDRRRRCRRLFEFLNTRCHRGKCRASPHPEEQREALRLEGRGREIFSILRDTRAFAYRLVRKVCNLSGRC